MNKSVLRYLLYVILVITGGSCKTQKTDTDKTNPLDTIELDSSLVKSGVLTDLDYAIENLRTSDELIKVVAIQQELYDEQVLNSIKNAGTYESSKAKALNIGVYGADLNYVIHFNQIPTSFKYLVCAKQLADQIGVTMAFDKTTVDNFNSNVNQKDTLINIVHAAYEIIKKYLRNGDQFQVATLVMAGSWIENVYLTMQMYNNVKSEDNKKQICSTILKQKEYVEKITTLLNRLNKSSDPNVTQLQNEFQTIHKIIQSCEGKTVFDKSDFKKMNTKVEEIRNFIVGLK